MILRLPMQVQILNERGEVVQSISSTKKSQIRLKLHGLPRSKWQIGRCKVWYSKPNDLWTQFSFTNSSQLEEGLISATEKPLIDFLKPEIPKEYLAKRKATPAQRAAIALARSKSTLKGVVNV